MTSKPWQEARNVVLCFPQGEHGKSSQDGAEPELQRWRRPSQGVVNNRRRRLPASLLAGKQSQASIMGYFDGEPGVGEMQRTVTLRVVCTLSDFKIHQVHRYQIWFASFLFLDLERRMKQGIAGNNSLDPAPSTSFDSSFHFAGQSRERFPDKTTSSRQSIPSSTQAQSSTNCIGESCRKHSPHKTTRKAQRGGHEHCAGDAPDAQRHGSPDVASAVSEEFHWSDVKDKTSAKFSRDGGVRSSEACAKDVNQTPGATAEISKRIKADKVRSMDTGESERSDSQTPPFESSDNKKSHAARLSEDCMSAELGAANTIKCRAESQRSEDQIGDVSLLCSERSSTERAHSRSEHSSAGGEPPLRLSCDKTSSTEKCSPVVSPPERRCSSETGSLFVTPSSGSPGLSGNERREETEAAVDLLEDLIAEEALRVSSEKTVVIPRSRISLKKVSGTKPRNTHSF